MSTEDYLANKPNCTINLYSICRPSNATKMYSNVFRKLRRVSDGNLVRNRRCGVWCVFDLSHPHWKPHTHTNTARIIYRDELTRNIPKTTTHHPANDRDTSKRFRTNTVQVRIRNPFTSTLLSSSASSERTLHFGTRHTGQPHRIQLCGCYSLRSVRQLQLFVFAVHQHVPAASHLGGSQLNGYSVAEIPR